jgi:hypothetical protein
MPKEHINEALRLKKREEIAEMLLELLKKSGEKF